MTEDRGQKPRARSADPAGRTGETSHAYLSCVVCRPSSVLLQSPQHAFELIRRAVVYLQYAAATALGQRDREPQRVGETLLERNRIGAFSARLAPAGFARRMRTLLRQRFHLTHVETSLHDLARHAF